MICCSHWPLQSPGLRPSTRLRSSASVRPSLAARTSPQRHARSTGTAVTAALPPFHEVIGRLAEETLEEAQAAFVAGGSSPGTQQLQSVGSIRTDLQRSIMQYSDAPNTVASAANPEASQAIGTGISFVTVLGIFGLLFGLVWYFYATRDSEEVRATLQAQQGGNGKRRR